eukprot:7928001-Alexandrium_andersonii.AAC.1
MSASLVGSEMCIRDSSKSDLVRVSAPAPPGGASPSCCRGRGRATKSPVSYTHLTLPTICSV